MDVKGIFIGIALGATSIIIYTSIAGNNNVLDSFIKKDSQQMMSQSNKIDDTVSKTYVTDMDYQYSQLQETDRTLYIEILSALQNHIEERKLSTTDESSIDKVFTCVMYDHPEIFYVDGYQYVKVAENNELTDIIFKGNYTMTKEEVNSYQPRVENYISKCIAGIPSGDDYSKIKYIYDYVISNTEYDRMAASNQTILSAMINGRSVCNGYAKTMQLLLQKAGIRCTVVTGVANNEAHIWNLVYSDGEWYHVDPTWGDSSYLIHSNGNIKESVITYENFMVTTDEISKSHKINMNIEIPLCTATDDNYYVREGSLIESYDAEKIGLIFNRAFTSDKGYITLKCKDLQSFNEVKEKLITEQEVFKLLGDEYENIRYQEDSSLFILSFYY